MNCGVVVVRCNCRHHWVPFTMFVCVIWCCWKSTDWCHSLCFCVCFSAVFGRHL